MSAFGLNVADLVVLRAYEEHGAPCMNGFAVVSATGLAEETGLDRRTVENATQKVTALGYLERAAEYTPRTPYMPRRITAAGVEARNTMRAALFGDLD